jgi:hypothetical protein
VEDLSGRARDSLWTVGQHNDAITSNHAMTAPGSPSNPGWSRVPDPLSAPAVEMIDHSRTTVTHAAGGAEPEREDWGP